MVMTCFSTLSMWAMVVVGEVDISFEDLVGFTCGRVTDLVEINEWFGN